MKISKVTSKIIFLALLLVFTFSFVHSELDQFKARNDDHSQHDYCLLIKTMIVQDIQIKYFDFSKIITDTINYQLFDIFSIPINFYRKIFHSILKSPPHILNDISIIKSSLLI
jgi:hypothetical protein